MAELIARVTQRSEMAVPDSIVSLAVQTASHAQLIHWSEAAHEGGT